MPNISYPFGFTPFAIPEVAEDGHPFEAWDGSTVFVQNIYSPAGKLTTPSKSSGSLIRVYGAGSQYCIGPLPLDQISELAWRAKWLSTSIADSTSVGVTATSDAGVGGHPDLSTDPTDINAGTWVAADDQSSGPTTLPDLTPGVLYNASPLTDTDGNGWYAWGTPIAPFVFRRDLVSIDLSPIDPATAPLVGELSLIGFPGGYYQVFSSDGSTSLPLEPSQLPFCVIASASGYDSDDNNDDLNENTSKTNVSALFSIGDSGTIGGLGFTFGSIIGDPFTPVKNGQICVPSSDNVIRVGPNEYWLAPFIAVLPDYRVTGEIVQMSVEANASATSINDKATADILLGAFAIWNTAQATYAAALAAAQTTFDNTVNALVYPGAASEEANDAAAQAYNAAIQAADDAYNSAVAAAQIPYDMASAAWTAAQAAYAANNHDQASAAKQSCLISSFPFLATPASYWSDSSDPFWNTTDDPRNGNGASSGTQTITYGAYCPIRLAMTNGKDSTIDITGTAFGMKVESDYVFPTLGAGASSTASATIDLLPEVRVKIPKYFTHGERYNESTGFLT